MFTLSDVPEIIIVQMYDDGYVRVVMDHESDYISSKPVEYFNFRGYKSTEAFGVDFYDITNEEALYILNTIKFDYLNDKEEV